MQNQKRKIRAILTLLLLLFINVNTLFASGTPPPPVQVEVREDEFYIKAVDFFQGEGVLEAWFIEKFLPLYDTFLESQYGDLIYLGQCIAAIATMCYLGLIGWQMQSGDREWEIMPILKPFGIAFILMNWISFVQMIKIPIVQLQQYSQVAFQAEQDKLNQLRITRYKYQMILIDVAVSQAAQAQYDKDAQEKANESLWDQGVDAVGDMFRDLASPIYEAYFKLQINFNMLLTSAIEIAALWLLRACAYIIFFIQILFSTFLIMVGPISMAISIFPIFASSFGQWIARFVNINLYGFVAFLILRIGAILQRFAYEAEIERYQKIISNDGLLLDPTLFNSLISNGVMSFGLVIICFIVTGIGVLMTPTLANYIVSQGSNSQAMSKVKQAAMQVATKGMSSLKL